jgi:hypothetical protein
MVTINNDMALNELLQNWPETPPHTKKAFLRLKDHLSNKTGLTLDFNARPGVTYSLRAKHDHQHQRPLFAMIDIIDDDPPNRWLSVCFYGEMISDPDDIGDFVPEGLFGEDAHCFDIEAWDARRLEYIIDRIDEAYRFVALIKAS